MYKLKLEKNIRCPLEYGLDIFGGKWKSRIICVLNFKGIVRYSRPRKDLANITDAVLSASLKELIKDGIIRRKQYGEIPPCVEYSLKDLGKSVLTIFRSICAGFLPPPEVTAPQSNFMTALIPGAPGSAGILHIQWNGGNKLNF